MQGMISAKVKWIFATLLVMGLVLATQAGRMHETYLPVLHNRYPHITPSIPGTTPTSTPTNTPTPTSTPTSTPTPTQTPTPTTSPLPTHQINTKLEIEMNGPQSTGMGDPNPFLIEVDVTFSGPGGQFTVPGFYDGDGVGGMDGDVWKARFTPDQIGVWTYTSSSPESLLNGYSGAFMATSPTGCSAYIPGGFPDFSCLGKLKYVGEHYLGFANGTYWFKAGVNDPEAFLDPSVNGGFSNYVDAIDFLVGNGVNAQYMLFTNLGGDGSFLYPWVGSNPMDAQTNHERYNLAKLATWEDIFDYQQDHGIVLHLVFEDDSGWNGFNRDLYYREMIARFGHYNGLIWNIAEEFNENDNYTPEQIKEFAQMISDLDAYDHPLTVHHLDELDSWLPFIDDDRFDLTSFQQHISPVTQQNAAAVHWFKLVDDPEVRTIPVSFDELRYFPGATQDPPLDIKESRHAVWGVFMGGGIYELRVSPDDSYTVFEPHMEDMHRARTFMEQLPYWQMKPMNGLLDSGQGYVFAKLGDVYAVYLFNGGSITLNLTGASKIFDGDWFNPRDGTYQDIGSVSGGSVTIFNAPSGEDWVLYLR